MARLTRLWMSVALLSAGSAWADLRLPLPSANNRTGSPPAELAAPAQRAPEISPREAARVAQARNGGGRVLAVNLSPDRSHYRVKLIKHGEVRVLHVPSR